MQFPSILLLLVSLAAFSQAADQKLPEKFTCKGGRHGDESHTFISADCDQAAGFLALGKAPVASCNDCALGLVGSDGKPALSKKALSKTAIVNSLKSIIDSCQNPNSKGKPHRKRDDNQGTVVLALSTQKKCSPPSGPTGSN